MNSRGQFVCEGSAPIIDMCKDPEQEISIVWNTGQKFSLVSGIVNMLQHRKLLFVLIIISVCSLAGFLDVTYRRRIDGYLLNPMRVNKLIKDDGNDTSISTNYPDVTITGNETQTTVTSQLVVPSSDSIDAIVPASYTDAARWVLVLSYQRTGSSFIGGIFNDSGRTFYVYEPLDPLYASMYGVPVGWTVPSDVFSKPDGSLRSIPEDELAAVSWTLEKIYTCQMSSLPVALMVHGFWNIFHHQMTHASGYVKCLHSHNVYVERALDTCQRHIKARCGTRFQSKPFNQDKCKSYLWGDAGGVAGSEYTPRCQRYRHQINDPDLPTDFRMYFECLKRLEPAVTKCAAEHLDTPCRQMSLRVVKTVRANMETATRLMHHHDDTYIIHLYRDPRGAVRSRLEATWSQSLWSRHSTTKEAQLYCSQVLADIRRRQVMEQDGYQSNIRELIYDGYVQEPLLNLLDIYNFIGQEPSMAVKDKYIANRQLSPNQNAESIANKWTKSLKPDQIKAIMTNCAQFFNATTFHWS